MFSLFHGGLIISSSDNLTTGFCSCAFLYYIYAYATLDSKYLEAARMMDRALVASKPFPRVGFVPA